jgi:NADH dehydrogenase
MKVAITGANSSVGKNLLVRLSKEEDITIVAGVRNEKVIPELPKNPAIKPTIINYDDIKSLEKALDGADIVIHLAGILIETKHSNYANANIAATAAIVGAAKKSDVKSIIFISVVGASPESRNAYFRSKGVAEELVLSSGLGARILRTPILFGPNAAGSQAIIGMISSGQAKLLGGGHYQMRPLDIDDLSEALTILCSTSIQDQVTYELVGPESAPYRDIIEMTAQVMGKTIVFGNVPILLAKFGAAITSILKGGGITPTVIDVITQDEIVKTNADSALGITLTPMKRTLEKMTSLGD